jgi:hypothetical protein
VRLTQKCLNHHNRECRHLLTPKKVFIDLPIQSSTLSLLLYLDISSYRVRLHLPKLRQVTPSDHMDIDTLVQTITRIGRVSRAPGEWWVAQTTNTDTPMPSFNIPVIDLDKEVLNTSRNILADEEPNFSRQAISRPNDDLWHSAIEAEMDVLRHNHT